MAASKPQGSQYLQVPRKAPQEASQEAAPKAQEASQEGKRENYHATWIGSDSTGRIVITGCCTSSLEGAQSRAVGHALLTHAAGGAEIGSYQLAGLAGGYGVYDIDFAPVAYSGEPPASQSPAVRAVLDLVAARPPRPPASQQAGAAARGSR